MSWRLARSLVQLQNELDATYPNRTTPDWALGDTSHQASASDHNPNGDGVVCAIDVRGGEMGKILWNHLRSVQDERLKYMIFQDRIMSSEVSPWTSRHYGGSNPHNTHIHISVGRGDDGQSYRADLYDDTSSWAISRTEGNDDDMSVFWGLEKGDKGPNVGLLQRFLERFGGEIAEALGDYGPNNDGVDDHYWTATAEALRLARVYAGSRGLDGYGDKVTDWALEQLDYARNLHAAEEVMNR